MNPARGWRWVLPWVALIAALTQLWSSVELAAVQHGLCQHGELSHGLPRASDERLVQSAPAVLPRAEAAACDHCDALSAPKQFMLGGRSVRGLTLEFFELLQEPSQRSALRPFSPLTEAPKTSPPRAARRS